MTDKPNDDDKKPDIEYSQAGNPVIRLKDQNRPRKPARGDSKLSIAIREHIREYIGEPNFVFNEKVSDLIRLDVHWITPTPERNFHTLITSGMSERPMIVPTEIKHAHYAELIMCLPPEWKIGLDAFKDHRNFWVMKLIKDVARLPHDYNTWLGLYHTVRNAHYPEPYASNTQFCGAFIFLPLMFGEKVWDLQVNPKKKIDFFSVVPIYKEEMDIKLKYGGQRLADMLMDEGITELIDLKRKNVGLSVM